MYFISRRLLAKGCVLTSKSSSPSLNTLALLISAPTYKPGPNCPSNYNVMKCIFCFNSQTLHCSCPEFHNCWMLAANDFLVYYYQQMQNKGLLVRSYFANMCKFHIFWQYKYYALTDKGSVIQ